MPRQTFTVTLGVRSPFLFAAIEPSAHGLDSSALRMADGLPVLPGDHLRGHLRHAACALFGKTSPQVLALFGKAPPERGEASDNMADVPQRGALIVGDLVAEGLGQRSMSLAHRVKIEAETGAAEEGMLQVIELVAPPDTVVTFEGTITVRPSGPKGSEMPASIQQTLESLLLLVSHVGGLKSAGFGEVETRKIVARDEPALKPDPFQLPDRVTLELGFDRPLLVDAEHQAFNVLVGNAVVPGAALKGALAEAMRDAGLLKDAGVEKALSTIRISHAFPVADNGGLADRVLPSALARAGHSAAFCFTPADMDTLCVAGVPAFPGDWKDKDFDWARGALKRPSSNIRRQARGRVGINEGGTAKDALLFVTDLVETEGRKWRVELSRNGADPAVFKQVVALFAAGFAGLGRTGAVVSGVKAAKASPAPASVKTGRVVVLLETPTVMTDPASKEPLPDQYLGYFRKLLGEGVTSVQTVATRRMAGAFYAHRYAIEAGRYQPFALSEAGATFALDLDTVAATKLTGCLSTGLPPLHNGKLLTDPNDWKVCPFVPENGFGEMTVLDEAAIDAVRQVNGEAA